jgi:hypothetical protein
MAPLCFLGRTMSALEQWGGAEAIAVGMRALAIVSLIIWRVELGSEVDQYNSCVSDYFDGQINDDGNGVAAACVGATACCEWEVWGGAGGRSDAEALISSVVASLVLFSMWLLVSTLGACAGLLGSAAEAKARAGRSRRRGGGDVEMGGAVAAAAEATLQVRLPPDARPGQTMSIVGPRGQPLTFTVPPSARGGQVVAIGVPPVRAPQLATAVVQEQPVMVAAAVVVDPDAGRSFADLPVVVAQRVPPLLLGSSTKLQQTAAWEQQQRRHAPPPLAHLPQPVVVQGTVVRPGGSSLDGSRGGSLDRAP